MENREVVLVFGGTGRLGVRLIHFLLLDKVPTRVVVRSRTELQKIFKGRENQLESIVQIPNFMSVEGKTLLEKAFQGNVRYVINGLGENFKGGKAKTVEFDIAKEVIDLAKKYKIAKYVMCSSALITKITHPFPWIMDLFTNVYVYKSMAQNYLRQSGLKYTIVRPGGLKGEWDLNQFPASGYALSQGDNTGGGRIHRSTVAKLCIDCLYSKTLKDNVTFECKSDDTLSNQAYESPERVYEKLTADTQKDIVTANHRVPRYVTVGGILSLVGFLILI